MEPKESNSSKHFQFSLAKSGVRMIGYLFMAFSGVNLVMVAGIFLLMAEVLGILEEI